MRHLLPRTGSGLARRHVIASQLGRRLMLARPVLDVAATEIRRALAAGGPCPQLPAAVLAHIRRHGLYNDPAKADHSVHAHNEAP